MPDTNPRKPGPPRLGDIIAMCFWSWVLFVALHLLRGRWLHVGIDTAAVALTGLLWYLARHDSGRHRALLGNLNLLVSLVGLIFATLFSGQSLAMACWYFALVPLVAVYQSGARSAAIWSVFSVAALVAVHYSTTLYPISPGYIAAGTEVLWGQLFLVGVLFLSAWASHRENARYIRALEEYERALIDKADALEAHAMQLQIARDEALTALRVKGEFLANMSHEVRTPLNGVLGMTRVLLNTRLSPDQRKMLSSIDTSGQALMNVIDDVLDFSKIEAGEMQIESNPFSLRDCIEDVLELFSRTAHEKGIDIAYLQHENVPTRLLGDVHRVRQVLLNLVNNAVKFTEPHTDGFVIVETMRRGDQIEIRITDSGIGISEEDHAKLFQSFVQVDSSMARRFGGTGLGLAISRGLVEAMKGRVSVLSQVDVGSTFTVELPLAEAPVLLQTMELDDAIALLDTNLLIIAGNSPTRKALVHMTTSWSMNVAATLDIEVALDLIDLDPPDLVVVWDNDEAQRTFEAIHERLHGTPTLVCTSLVDASRVVDSFDGIIHRPVRLQHVLSALLNAMHMEGRNADATHSVSEQLPLNVLIVEDNAVNQQIVVNMMERLGYSPTVASSGQEAVELAKKQTFDFVFMDMHMPDMDGLEATRRIRANDEGKQGPWIAALTASVAEEQKAACLAAGMNDFVPKPFRFDTLISAIERAGQERGWLKTMKADTPQIDSLRDVYKGREGDFKVLLRRHIETSDELLASLKQAVFQWNPEEVEITAHSLKSSSAMFGESEISRLAAILERAAKHNSPDPMSDTVNDLEAAWQSARLRWKHELENDRP